MHRERNRQAGAARASFALVLCTLLALVVVAEAVARTDNRRKPVVFVHGLAPDGSSNCASTWNDVKRKFRDWGHTGGFSTVAYYGDDRECSHWISHHGSHRAHYYRYGHQPHENHQADTDIRHLGYHFAWFAWTHFSKRAAEASASQRGSDGDAHRRKAGVHEHGCDYGRERGPTRTENGCDCELRRAGKC